MGEIGINERLRAARPGGAPAAAVNATEAAKYALLVESRLLSFEELSAAIQEAHKNRKGVESILVSRHRIAKQAIGESLSAFYHCPFAEFSETFPVNLELVGRISLSYLTASLWFPLQVENNTVHIIIEDPRSPLKLQDIHNLFPGNNVRFYVGLREDILKYIDAVSKGAAAPRTIGTILDQVDAEPAVEAAAELEPSVTESDSVVVRLVNQIIADACKAGASDIHIEPNLTKDTFIRFRVDGECQIYQRIPARYRRALVSRLKVMAGLDIAERRKPQDGRIGLRLGDADVELRVATIPTSGDNEDVVLRILASKEPPALDELHFTQNNLRDLKAMLEMPHGMILCVGPTGSGKTTTLHSSLFHLNGPDVKIWTAEDPVEISQFGLRQVQVNAKIGLTFATALRSFLRADPDVVMVGEMRDKETCEIAIQAALTGHLVLSTLHTNSAAETVTRLLDMGMDPFNYSEAILAVLAQRLVRTICPDCKEAYHPSREEFDELAHGFGEESLAGAGFAYDERTRLYEGRGCAKCKQTGYKGRVGIHELLIANDAVKTLIQQRAGAAEIQAIAAKRGMLTLLQDGILKCFMGLTDFSQVKAAAAK